jgi:5-methylcytosine-specific restriction endonuclease McrA
MSRYKKTYHKIKPTDQSIYLEEHRDPPKPDHYYDDRKGYCRMCGQVIKTDQGELNTRARWHVGCVDQYNIIYNPGMARKHLWSRDRGECAQCGDVMPKRSRAQNLKWHVDHIRPLYEQKGLRFEQLDLSYWEEDNLQTLCQPCHVEKSADEAASRASMRKEKSK